MTHSPTPANPAKGVTTAEIKAFREKYREIFPGSHPDRQTIVELLNASKEAVPSVLDDLASTYPGDSDGGIRAAIDAGGQAVAEPIGFIDRHRQKFASAGIYDATILHNAGWTPVYAHSLPLKEEVERVLDFRPDFGATDPEPALRTVLRYYYRQAFDAKEADEFADRYLQTLLSRLLAGAKEGWRPQAADDVLAERKRQVEAEGWTPEHDDSEHRNGQLAIAAACYAISAGTHDGNRQLLKACRWTLYEGNQIVTAVYWLWSLTIKWSSGWWKPSSRRRDLVKAGALILAEIERLDRAAPSPEAKGGRS